MKRGSFDLNATKKKRQNRGKHSEIAMVQPRMCDD